MMNWNYDDRFSSGGHNLFMAAMMIFWLIAIAVAVWAIIRVSNGRKPVEAMNHTHPGSPSAMTGENSPRAILDRRLASGEINGEQYLEAKKLLGLD